MRHPMMAVVGVRYVALHYTHSHQSTLAPNINSCTVINTVIDGHRKTVQFIDGATVVMRNSTTDHIVKIRFTPTHKSCGMYVCTSNLGHAISLFIIVFDLYVGFNPFPTIY